MISYICNVYVARFFSLVLIFLLTFWHNSVVGRAAVYKLMKLCKRDLTYFLFVSLLCFIVGMLSNGSCDLNLNENST